MVENEIASLRREIERLNRTLERVWGRDTYFVYSTNFLKFSFYNFWAGLLRSLGSLLGTVLVLTVGGFIIARLLSQIDLTQVVSSWVQQVMEESVKNLESVGKPPINPPAVVP